MKILDYLQDTRAEMKHVSWPTQRQVIAYTLVVIILSLVTAALLGAFDYLFSWLLSELVLR